MLHLTQFIQLNGKVQRHEQDQVNWRFFCVSFGVLRSVQCAPCLLPCDSGDRCVLSQILRSFLEMMKKIIILRVVTCQIQSVCSVPWLLGLLHWRCVVEKDETTPTSQTSSYIHQCLCQVRGIYLYQCMAVWLSGL